MIASVCLSLCLTCNSVQGQNCEKLPDGKYTVKIDKTYGGEVYTILLENDQFTEYREGKETKGRIELNEGCSLVLDYMVKWDTTHQTQELLSKSSKPSFEFKKTNGKKLSFRLTGYGGPHTTASEGFFIKMN